MNNEIKMKKMDDLVILTNTIKNIEVISNCKTVKNSHDSVVAQYLTKDYIVVENLKKLRELNSIYLSDLKKYCHYIEYKDSYDIIVNYGNYINNYCDRMLKVEYLSDCMNSKNVKMIKEIQDDVNNIYNNFACIEDFDEHGVLKKFLNINKKSTESDELKLLISIDLGITAIYELLREQIAKQ